MVSRGLGQSFPGLAETAALSARKEAVPETALQMMDPAKGGASEVEPFGVGSGGTSEARDDGSGGVGDGDSNEDTKDEEAKHGTFDDEKDADCVSDSSWLADERVQTSVSDSQPAAPAQAPVNQDGSPEEVDRSFEALLDDLSTPASENVETSSEQANHEITEEVVNDDERDADWDEDADAVSSNTSTPWKARRANEQSGPSTPEQDGQSTAHTQRSASQESAVTPRSRFTPEEDALLKRLKEVSKLKFPDIVKHFSGRTYTELRHRYYDHLATPEAKRQYGTRTPKQSTNASPTTPHIPFTPEEDALLKSLIEVSKRKFDHIAKQFPGRTPAVLNYRYYTHLAAPETKSQRPGRRLFTREEDALLLRLRDEENQSFESMQRKPPAFPGRPPSSLASRYRFLKLGSSLRIADVSGRNEQTGTGGTEGPNEHLQPELGGSWRGRHYSGEEDAKLLRLREEGVLSWADTVGCFEGRSKASLMGRYALLTSTAEGEEEGVDGVEGG